MRKQTGFTLIEVSVVVAIAMFSPLGLSKVNGNIVFTESINKDKITAIKIEIKNLQKSLKKAEKHNAG